MHLKYVLFLAWFEQIAVFYCTGDEIIVFQLNLVISVCTCMSVGVANMPRIGGANKTEP